MTFILGWLFTTFGSDIRTIGQKQVDLQPIHDWKAAKAEKRSGSQVARTVGERPLPHWKDVVVEEYVKSVGDPIVVAKVGGGATQTIVLNNCPTALVSKLIRLQSLTEQLKSAKLEVNRASAKALETAGKASRGRRASRQQRKEAADAKARVKLAEGNEQAIAEEIATLEQAVASEGNLLAMATCSTYAGFPVWDTGMTSRKQ
jgi:hypothetical protein